MTFKSVNDISLSITVLEEISLKIDIINISGRRVKTLHQGELSPANYIYRWNAKDETGALVSSGVYFIKADDGSNQEWIPITLVK